MRVRIYGDGVVRAEFDAVLQCEMAHKVAKAMAKSGRVVVMEEDDPDGGVSYIGPNYARSPERIEWPAKVRNPVGRQAKVNPDGSPVKRGRPAIDGESVTVRLTGAAIAKAKELGMGDIKAGIIAALRQAMVAE